MTGEYLILAFPSGSVQVLLTIQHELIRCSFGGTGVRLDQKPIVCLFRVRDVIQPLFDALICCLAFSNVDRNDMGCCHDIPPFQKYAADVTAPSAAVLLCFFLCS